MEQQHTTSIEQNTNSMQRYHIDAAMKRVQAALGLTDREMDTEIHELPRQKCLTQCDALLADALDAAFGMDYPHLDLYRTCYYGRAYIASLLMRQDPPAKVDEDEIEILSQIMDNFTDQAANLQVYDPAQRLH